MSFDFIDTKRNRIYVSVTKQNCSTPQAFTINETATSITIAAWGTPVEPMCTAVGVALVGYIVPSAPIGHRTIRG